jgi:peptidase M28-like protein/PA domain-containing protein
MNTRAFLEGFALCVLGLLPAACTDRVPGRVDTDAFAARSEATEVESAPLAAVPDTTVTAVALAASPQPPQPSVRSGDARLEAALNAIEADKISADLHFIASDEMGGRDTPSPGQRIAARFIRARLQRLGWQPGAPDGFFFIYKLANQQLDERGTRAWAAREGKRVDFKFGQDYFFHSSGTTTAEFSGDLVFCGKGEADDFKDLDLGGKWALCFDSETSYRTRQSAAKKAGALGVIVTPGPDYKDKDYAERYRDYAERARRPSVRWPPKTASEGASSTANAASPGSAAAAPGEGRERVFPYVYLTAKAGAQLFALAQLDPAGGQPADGGPALPKPGESLQVSFSDVRKEVGEGGMIEVENVCGFWPGGDPELSKEVILVSAHYDHVGTDKNGVVFNGADDNGSGTCGLMAIAEALAVHGPMARSVMLLWVSGEEHGLWGSQAWTEHPWLPEGCRPICDINIDMIGRNEPGKLLITPTQERPEDYNGLVKLAESLSPLEGFPKLGSCDEYWHRSDHANFAKNLKIPVTFLFSDVHEDYHQPTDDPDKIDYDKVHRVARLVVRMIDGLQAPVLDIAAHGAR